MYALHLRNEINLKHWQLRRLKLWYRGVKNETSCKTTVKTVRFHFLLCFFPLQCQFYNHTQHMSVWCRLSTTTPCNIQYLLVTRFTPVTWTRSFWHRIELGEQTRVHSFMREMWERASQQRKKTEPKHRRREIQCRRQCPNESIRPLKATHHMKFHSFVMHCIWFNIPRNLFNCML